MEAAQAAASGGNLRGNGSSTGGHRGDPLTSPDGPRSEDSSLTLPLTGTSPTTSSSSEGPQSPPAAAASANNDKSSSNGGDVDSLKLLLQEVNNTNIN